ncbi:hypothetical protein ACFVR1_17075 [Psychrobacillus sp. NPDC058041]|uniref:hypothetical protein n=1 Tax=Psychrobacillus sp. NPDC058041 TaxID=3346310 RepID=UPI0036D7FCA1
MDDRELEERLDLLKSSYERVPSNFDADEVLSKLEDEKVQSINVERHKSLKWQKVTIWAVSIASLFIIGILGSSYLLKENAIQGEEQLSESAKEFIDRLKKEYPIAREKRREVLNLPEEEFSQIELINSADSYFQYITDSRYHPLYYNSSFNQDEAYKSIIDKIKLPSEMVTEIKKQDTLDKAETIEFLNAYNLKVNSFKEYANEKLDEQKDELSAYKVNGLYKINKILENERFLSKDFHNLRKNAESQGLKMEIIENGLDIRFTFDFEQYYSEIFSIKLDPISKGYLLMMQQAPFTYASELIYPLYETMTTLLSMEDYLLDEYVKTNGDSKMETYFTSVFYLLVKGTIENPVFDENGVVKEEYKKIWRTMANEETNSPSPYLLIPIVKEFEQSGWKKSEAWDDFSYGDIVDALHLAKNGDLEQFMPERLAVKNSETETLVDNDFLQRVHGLYKSFAKTHDQTVLKNAKPEEIVGLYYYCSQLEDEESKYELYIKDDQYVQIPKEEYMNAPHEKIPDLSKEFSSLRFEQRSNKEGYVVLTLHPDRTLNLEDREIGFGVIQTENGWRAAFMPTQ